MALAEANRNRLRWTIQKKLFLSHFLAVFLISGSVGTFFYISAIDSLMTNLRTRLQNSAALISEAIDASDLDVVRSPADVGRPEYLAHLEQLRRFRRTNPDIAFLYIMRLSGDDVRFVVDSDETKRQAVPGRRYVHVVPELRAGFARPSVDREVQTDEWGSFMSGYAPVRNGRGAYLLGIDMRADEVEEKLSQIRFSGIVSLVCSLVLALVFSRIISRRLVTPIRVLVDRCTAIGNGQLEGRVDLRTRDELDSLLQAFNTMSSGLLASREANRRAEDELRRAKEELEVRVAERTRDLSDLNEKLRREIAERKKVEEALELAARTDPLTGMLNRRAMQEQIEYQMIRWKRNLTPFALLLGDIDLFKRINDTYGHMTGDKVLQNIATYLRGSIRAQDFVGRWGGEEFLVLLPDTDIAGGVAVAEKMRRGMAGVPYPEGVDDAPLTISVGVTAYGPEQSIDECIRRADAALYEAKRQGRDRVVAKEGSGIGDRGPGGSAP